MRSLFALILLLLLSASTVFGQACTHWASPTGTGNGLSVGAPFQIKDFTDQASPGETLCLLTGVYTGDQSMIDPPDNVNGTSGSRITVKALTDGGPLIDGQNARQPVSLKENDYWTIEGINARNSPFSVVGISTGANNNIIRRVIAWDSSASDNVHVFAVNYGSDNLLEDIAGWGRGRKILGMQQDTRTTLRRGFFRWAYTTNTAFKLTATFSYQSFENLMENCIGTFDAEPGADPSQREAIFSPDRNDTRAGGTIRFLGNIAYSRTAQTQVGSKLIQHGENPNNGILAPTQIVWNDSLALRQTATPTYGIFPFSNQSGTNFTDWIGPASASGSGTTEDGSSTWAQMGGAGLLRVNDSTRPSRGAWLRYRYVNGTLTGTELWPWPMNQRIKDAMITSGYNNKGGLDGTSCGSNCDLTAVIFAITGDVPSTAQSQLVMGTQPTNTQVATAMDPITVEVRDGAGNLLTGSTASITATLQNCATLSGTNPKSAVAGIATFSNLQVSTVDTGCTLLFSSSGLVSEQSASFDITAVPVSLATRRYRQVR